MMNTVVATTKGRISVALVRRGPRGVLHYVFWHNGKRFRGTTKQTSEREALKAARNAVLDEVENTAQHKGELLLKDAIDRMMQERWPGIPLKSGNQHQYDTHKRLKWFVNEVGNIDLASLDNDELVGTVQDYLDKRAINNAPRTVWNDKICLCRFFSWLKQKRLLGFTVNPASANALVIKKPVRKIRPAPNPEDINSFISSMQGNEILPVAVLLCSGLRPRGAIFCRWEKVELGKSPSVEITEKGIPRAIPLSSWAAGELQKWREAHPGPETVWPYDAEKFWREWRKWRLGSKLPANITPQAFRRMTVRQLWAAGVPPQLCAKIMGHSIAVALRDYGAMETLNARDAVSALGPPGANRGAENGKPVPDEQNGNVPG